MDELAWLGVPPSELKTLRETLCRAQGALVYQYGHNRAFTTEQRERLAFLIDEIDRHRPVGPDGTHGNRHTETCGCEDK